MAGREKQQDRRDFYALRPVESGPSAPTKVVRLVRLTPSEAVAARTAGGHNVVRIG
jgi:hypothetical protein